MKRIAWFFFIIIILLSVVVMLAYHFRSPIAKYEFEKHSIAWTGRKISIGDLKIDVRQGSVDIRNVKIYEAGSDSIFFECKDIFAKVNTRKIFQKIYEVDQFRIDTPEVHVTQSGNTFNFSDLIKRFSPAKNDSAKSPDVHYYIHRVTICNGDILYENKPIHHSFRIDDINLNVPEFSWDNPESHLHLDFKSGAGGDFNLDLDANRKTLNYNLSLLADKYNVSQYYAPLKTLLNVSSVKGTMATKLRIHGNFNQPGKTSFHGYLNLDDLELRDDDNVRFLAMKKLSLDVDSIDPGHNHFDVNHFILYDPYVVLNTYKVGNNFSRLLVEHETPAKPQPKTKSEKKDTIDYSNIFTVIESTFKAMAIDFLHTNYHADSITIRNGEFAYQDLTTANPFRYNVTKLNLVTSELSDLNEGVIFHANAKLGDSGRFVFKASLHYDRKNKKMDGKVDSLKFLNISPVANYVLRENSKKWIGRRVTTGKVNMIISKGGLFVKDTKVYEPNEKDIFFACHYVFIKINLAKLFDNKYVIEKIKIDKPEINIVQNGKQFNYDDIVQRFTSDSGKQRKDTVKSAAFPYVIDSIMIKGANIVYNNVPMHHILKLKDLNFMLPEVAWNKPQLCPHLDFKYGKGGSVNLEMDLNWNTSQYNCSLTINNCDLSQYYTPLSHYLNVSSLNGTLSAKLRLHGNLKSPDYFAASGLVRVNNLEITDTANRKVFGLDELKLDIDTMNVKHKMYFVRDITLEKPFVLFDYYAEGNNISNMIINNAPPVKNNSTGTTGPDYSNIFTLLSSSINLLVKDFYNTDFHTDSLVIRDGKVLYSDYTLKRDFHYYLSNLNLSTDEISDAKSNIGFRTSATLNNSGKFNLQATIGLHLQNMIFNYDVTNFRLTDINSYMEYYTGVPFIDGYANYKSSDSVQNRYLHSTNAIHISAIEVGKKVNDNPPYDLPIRFAVSLLKDNNGDIDLSIPASGNLDDPNYKMGKLLGRILTDLVVKAVESPFKHLAKLFKSNPDEMKHIDIEYLQDKLTDKQQSKLKDIHEILDKKKDIVVEITQVADSDAEADDLGIAMAKAMYYSDTKHIVHDSLLTHRQRKKAKKAEKQISSQDTLFNNYLNKKLHLTGNELIAVQDKCRMLVGERIVEGRVRELRANRNKAVSEYLVGKNNLPPERVKVKNCNDSLKIENIVQPDFEINYSVKDK